MSLEKVFKLINRRIGQLIKKAQRAVARQYAQALVEIRKLLAEQYEKYERNGELSIEDMVKYDRLNKLMQRINWIMGVNHKEVSKIMSKVLGDVYKEGYYLTAWGVETTSLTKLGYASVRPEALAAMLKNPIAGLTLNQRLERMRANIIYQIQQQVTQGLQNNETYAVMAKRLKRELENDVVKATRIVRTEGHRVSQSALNDSAIHANKNGVIMLKTWNTLEDERVRPAKGKKGIANHRMLNNKTIPVEEMFMGNLGKGPAPGNLGSPSEDINCRCFTTFSVERVERPQHDDLEKMTFEEWKKERLKTSEKTSDKKNSEPIVEKPKVEKPTTNPKKGKTNSKPKTEKRHKKNNAVKTNNTQMDRTKMHEVENIIRGNRTETGVVFDTNGKMVWRQKGNKNSVDITGAIKKGVLKGNILTHNHPGGSSFSPDDVYVLSQQELSSIRAVSNKHNYEVQLSDEFKEKSNTQRTKILREKISKYNTEVGAELAKDIDDGKISVLDANLNHWHLVWTRIEENEGIIKYTREENK